MIPLPAMHRAQNASDTPERPEFVPGVFIVKIKPDLVANIPDLNRSVAAAAKSFRLAESVEEPFRDLRRRRLIQEVVPVFAAADQSAVLAMSAAVGSGAARVGPIQRPSEIRGHTLAFARSVRQVADEDLRGINLIRVSAKTDLGPVMKELKVARGIEYCYRVPARWAATATPVPGTVNPMLNRQWGLRAIHWFDTGRALDARGVNVGVLDTGVDQSHPDLGPSVIASYSFADTSAEDIVGHGTHVCGIIAANPGNRVGVTGISNCKIHVWKIFGDVPAADGEYFVEQLFYLRALRAAQVAGMQIINLSIGGTHRSPTEEMLFKKLNGAGIIVVAAMGNDYRHGNPTTYPAAYPDVVAVGATEEADRRAPFSNTGSHIALSAPGANILSTLPERTSAYRKTADDTNYAAWSGTSMATPHVTAAASLILAANPTFSRKEVIDRLRSTAARTPAMGGKKRTNDLGSGLLDLKAAVN